MLLRLLLLFTVVPLVEFYLLHRLSLVIDLVPTIMLVLLTGVVGATLARQQGLATLAKLNRAMAGGEKLSDTLIDGAMILLAGAVLITPGVLTDAFGFALLAPPVRAVLKPRLAAWFRKRMKRGGGVTTFTWSSGPGSAGGPTPFEPIDQGRVVDVEVTEVRTKDDGK